MLNYIKSHDLFGHEVKFKISGQEKAYKTIWGGITSIVIKLVFILYTFMNLRKMILHEDNIELFYNELIKFDEQDPSDNSFDVHYKNDTNMFMFYMLTK